MSHRSDRDPSRATESGHAPEERVDVVPRQPNDSTAGGDAKSGAGEDNHGAKEGEQKAEDFIRR